MVKGFFCALTGRAAFLFRGNVEKPGQTDQKRGPTIPSGAHLCLVPEEVAPLGGPLGAHRGLL